MAKRTLKSSTTPYLASELSASEQNTRVQEHIERLQKRQMDLVNETTRELEELKNQLATNNEVENQVELARQPLLEEIDRLQSAVGRLEREREQARRELALTQEQHHTYYSQVQTAVNTLKNTISLLSHGDGAPVTAIPEPLAIKPAYVPAPAIAHELPAKPKKVRPPRKPINLRRLVLRGGVAFAVAVVAFGGWKFIQARPQASDGSVAGASTQAPSADTGVSLSDYPESHAIVPFDKTDWQTYTNTEFGVSVRYPKNTSNLVYNLGGSNFWFLRDDSYYMKVTREETQDLLDQWWMKNKGFYMDEGLASKGTFKGLTAWIIKPAETTDTSGTTYIVQRPTGVVMVWVKDFDPLSDDGKRMSKMVESLSFINPAS